MLDILPEKFPFDVVIDSDTGNETDDQFAVAFALLRPDIFRIKALLSAPFLHYRVLSPAEGEYVSHLEQKRILHYFPDTDTVLWRGMNSFYSANAPVSCGVRKLVELSRNYSAENPLVIICIATLSNMAQALKLDPTLPSRTVLLWLGGHGYGLPPDEFNLAQDLTASEIVLNSGWRKIIFPCLQVAEKISITWQAAEKLFTADGIGGFLRHRLLRHFSWSYGQYDPDAKLKLWDMFPVAALADRNVADFSVQKKRKLLLDPLMWQETEEFEVTAVDVDRNRVFTLLDNAVAAAKFLQPPDF